MTQAMERPSRTIKMDAEAENEINNLEAAIAQALEEARAACQTAGENSTECAVAWDIVEELQAERSHRETAKQKSGFDLYCLEHPEAIECLIYDV
jgi:Ribonuclease G/E